MKRLVYLTLAAAVALTSVTACQTKEKLAKEIEGTWTSVPEHINVDGFYAADMVRTYEFLGVSEDAGQVIISAMISVSKAINDSTMLVGPVTVSTAATATMTGDFEAMSYDKIRLVMDASSFNLYIDPSAVNFDYNALTEEESPEPATLNAVYASHLTEDLTPVIKAEFLSGDTITAIRVDESTFRGDINGHAIELHRQQPN